MKKRIFSILLAIVMVASVFALFSCDVLDHEHEWSEWKLYSSESDSCEDKIYKRYCIECNEVQLQQRSHDYGEDILYDTESHWYECKECGAKKDEANHTLEENACTKCEYILNSTEGIIYEVSEDGTYAIVVGYEGTEAEVVIANEYNNLPVTSISYDAFEDCDSLVSVIIPDSVTSIGGGAFYCCDSLYVVYNNSDLFLEIGSFNNGNLARYAKILVDNGETIYANDGYNYTLTDDGFLFREKDSKYELISYIGGENTVTLPENINGNSYDLYSMRGVVNVIIPESFTTINDYAFAFGCDSLVSVIIPDSVTSIGYGAFSGCSSLTSVVIPDSVTSIGDYAFYGCKSLVSVTIPDSVTSIGDHAFYCCDSLVSVIIPDSVTSIGDHAFYGCSSLVSVIIPDSVTSIDSAAFAGCIRLTSITVNANNQYYKSIDGNLYSKDGKTLIQYVIGKEDTSFEIPYGVTSIGSYAFDYCKSLVSVTIPDSVTTIGGKAFRSCYSLTSINIPDNVTSIGNSAFWYCYSLTSVVIGDSVTSIGESAFENCSSLSEVYYAGSAAEWNSISISAYNANLKNATRYYYSENQPTEEGNFWHWVDGKVVVWE